MSLQSATEQPATTDSANKLKLAEIPPRKPRYPCITTSAVKHDRLDSFKEFSAAEKLRMSERQGVISREAKAAKLGDLRKFAANFKLHRPIPTDLVPILANDEKKQQAIMEKHLAFMEKQQEKAEQTSKQMQNAKVMPLDSTRPAFVPSSASKAATSSSTLQEHRKKTQADVVEVKNGFDELQERLAKLGMNIDRSSTR